MKYTQESILVCMALPEEGGAALERIGINVLYTGLGKINAAYGLTKAIHQSRPQLVVNMGTAGSTIHPRGTLVACDQFMQRDMDVSPLGFPKYATPFEDTPHIITHKAVFTHLPHALCGTADRFETSHEASVVEVVDMEAYALAKICWLEGIDFACLKYVSDGADDNASVDWQTNVANAAALFSETLAAFLR